MKKFLTSVLAVLTAFSMAACASEAAPAASESSTTSAEATETAETTEATESTESTSEVSGKIGAIILGDENEGYSAAHINGIKKAVQNAGLDESAIIWKYNIGESQDCADAAADLVDQGATMIISNSYGHQTYMEQAAIDNPDVTYIAMTGDNAAGSGLANLKNAFNQTYQSRYVSGVVAGMKLQELIDNGTLTKENMPEAFEGDDIKIGYVGAFPYAEVVSGYTAFYLGVRSVVENVHMYVEYTNSWADLTAEGETANNLISKGCVIISQHADTTGAPSAIQAAFESGKTVYSVGYNISMTEVAPDAALTSATNDWSVYYTHAFNLWKEGKGNEIETDWSEGYESGAVAITALGSSAAEGTAEKVAEVEGAIKDGSLNVFDCSTFVSADGSEVTEETGMDLDFDGTADIFPVSNGVFHESDTKNGFRSAPYFSVRIAGIEESGN